MTCANLSSYSAGTGFVGGHMRAGLIVLAGLLGCAACAETRPTPALPPIALVSQFLMDLSPVRAEGAIHISDPRLVSRPVFDSVKSATPEYPTESLLAREKGPVTLALCVSEAGKVLDSAVVTSSSHERLDAASLDWARQATFTPAMDADGPVSVCGYSLTYEWRLTGAEFPEIMLLANAYALGVSPITPGPGERWIQLDGSEEDIERPVLKSGPPRPMHPESASQPPPPFGVDLCVAAEGRAVAVEGMPPLDPMAGIYVITYLNGLRFTPATRDGERVSVCGVPWQVAWREAR